MRARKIEAFLPFALALFPDLLLILSLLHMNSGKLSITQNEARFSKRALAKMKKRVEDKDSTVT